MSDTIKALIAARSGSLRVKNKNIRPFADSNLLTIKINQLLGIKGIDGVVVNSNDDETLSIAKSLGCEVVKRESYYASNTVHTSDLFVNMASNIDCDVVLYANCTNPLIENATIEKAINLYIEKSDTNDSLNTVHLVKEFLFKDGKPMNYDLNNVPRSQDLPDLYSINFAVNIISRDHMIKRKNVVGLHPYLYDIGRIEGTDIDDQIDFDFAEFYYKKYANLNEI